MSNVQFYVEMDIDNLARSIAAGRDYKGLTDYILAIDDHVADEDFTEELIRRLQEVLS